ncbi:signal peptide, CUB and EGF-like domain-containing protein 2 [Acropora millepora]|uniref:signal peptide, CUB and EGF-like domain-containing protein 2 n=1 Tax=Acropora millepora TaxID=45264 RepID=UPI001CF3FB1F|nr:signal peptide, CUB and EGF-like domain-containing protein 2 [Acropora millepora]
MKKSLPLTLLAMTLFCNQSAINAFPKPEVDSPCVPNELFDVCGEHMQCEKIVDTFRCRCHSGFLSKENNCEDIDECKEKDIRLECKEIGAECTNLPGSYECRCERGYQHGDEHCEDIDECSEDKCDAKAVCENTRGSYTCKCKTGFAGDGYQCILDEVYAQKQEINRIIIIGASTAGGSLLIILLIACLCCVNPKKPKPKKKKKAPKAPAVRDEWAADSSGSSGDSE